MTIAVYASDLAPIVDGVQLKRVQDVGYNATLDSEALREFANAGVVEYKDNVPRVAVTITLNEFDESLTQDLAFFNKTSAPISLPTDALSSLPCIELLAPIRWDGVFSETDWISRVFIERYSIDFDVNGYIRSTYTGTGDHLTYFLGTNKTAKVAVGTYASSSTFTVDGDISGKTALKARINEKVVPASAITIGTFSGGKTTVTVTGYALTSSDRIRLIYNDPSYTFPALSTPGIGGLRRGCADLYLYKAGTSENYWLRLQRATIDVPLGATELTQIGSKYPIARKLTVPFNLTLTVTVARNDLTDFTIFTEKTSPTEMSLEDLVRTAHFKAKIYNSETDRNTLLKVFTIEDLKVTGVDHRGTVGDAPLEVTYTLQADNIVISAS